MFAFALVYVERQHEQYSSPLELIYMNTFNCLCLFLIADLVQVGSDVSQSQSNGYQRLQDEVRDALMYLFASTTELFVVTIALVTVAGKPGSG